MLISQINGTKKYLTIAGLGYLIPILLRSVPFKEQPNSLKCGCCGIPTTPTTRYTMLTVLTSEVTMWSNLDKRKLQIKLGHVLSLSSNWAHKIATSCIALLDLKLLYLYVETLLSRYEDNLQGSILQLSETKQKSFSRIISPILIQSLIPCQI